jgi:hypothetical protein
VTATTADRSDEDEPGRARSGVLVLSVWPGPDGRMVARIRMSAGDGDRPGESAESAETVVTTASRTEVLDRVGAFLDSFPGDPGDTG